MFSRVREPEVLAIATSPVVVYVPPETATEGEPAGTATEPAEVNTSDPPRGTVPE